jgi:hypothetical protein
VSSATLAQLIVLPRKKVFLTLLHLLQDKLNLLKPPSLAKDPFKRIQRSIYLPSAADAVRFLLFFLLLFFLLLFFASGSFASLLQFILAALLPFSLL